MAFSTAHFVMQLCRTHLTRCPMLVSPTFWIKHSFKKYKKHLVNGFSAVSQISGCNISMDRYFTSIHLAQWTAQKNITIVGTTRLDRKGIPPQIQKVDNRNKKSIFFVCGEDDDLMLVSYIDKKNSGKKNMVVLTSMHDKIKVSKDERRKPQVHLLYDHTKAGVDVVDLLSSHTSTRIKTKRWPMNCLAFILHTTRTNANTILSHNNIKMTSLEFIYQLAKSLCIPNVHRWYNSIQPMVCEQIKWQK